MNYNIQLFAAHTISFKVKNFDSTTFNGLMYPSYACKYQKMSLILDHLIYVLARKFTFFKIMHKYHRMHIRGNRVPFSFSVTLTNSKVHTTKEIMYVQN